MFETVTAVSPWNVSAARRAQLFAGALLLHLTAAAIYLTISVWTIPSVSPPDFSEAFVHEFRPPEVIFVQPAPPPASTANTPEPTASAPVRAADAPPTVQPETIAQLEPANEELETMSRTLGEVGALPASSDSSLGQQLGTLPGGADLVPSVPLQSNMTPPAILLRTTPVYPELARKVGRKGVVTIEAEIGRDGRLRSARAVGAPLGFGLEEAALRALESWRFSPAQLNGNPIAVFYRLSVHFELR